MAKKQTKSNEIRYLPFDAKIPVKAWIDHTEFERLIKPYKELIEALSEENVELRKNAKEQGDKLLKEENENLKIQLDFAYQFFDSKKEKEAYKKFCKKHEKCQLSSKANGGKVPYIVFYGTGIGTCKKVICQVCGKEQDITDTDTW